MTPRPVLGRGAIVAGVLLGSSLVTFFLVGIFSDPRGPLSCGSDATSVSALGHRGLVELLERLERPVTVLRRSAAMAAHRRKGLHVVIEPPDGSRSAGRTLRENLRIAGNTLLVLPKRQGVRDARNPAWIAKAELESRTAAGAALEELGLPPGTTVARPATSGPPAGFESAVTLPEPEIDDVQLLVANSFRKLAWFQGLDGVLAGTFDVGDARVTVLSDPDVLSNHGLGRGGNAAFVVGLLDELRDGGPILIDDGFHGSGETPGYWKLLREYPLVLLPVQAAIVFLFLVWRGFGRFGVPAPAPAAVSPGKGFLVGNIAALLRQGGHHGYMLRQYARDRMRAAAKRLHAAPGLRDSGLAAWLAQHAADARQRARLADTLEKIERLETRRVTRREEHLVTALARRLHHVVAEIEHGRR